MMRSEQKAAIELFQSALAVEPGQATVNRNLAFSLQLAGRPEEALFHYALVHTLGTSHPALLVNEAIAHYEAGDRDAARAVALQALNLDSASAPAYTILGAAALPQRPEEAAHHLEKAIRADPGYVPAHFYLGLAAKLQDQTELAIAAFERVLALQPADPLARREARLHLSELYAQNAARASYRRPQVDEERR
jgi:Tfp pilus assembly protein PilF